jgi:hypothetical protein
LSTKSAPLRGAKKEPERFSDPASVGEKTASALLSALAQPDLHKLSQQ